MAKEGKRLAPRYPGGWSKARSPDTEINSETTTSTQF